MVRYYKTKQGQVPIMENKLEILLVEDDAFACKEITEQIDNSNEFILIGVTNNADKALQYIEEYLPDAVILDLELHHGVGSGLGILGGLERLGLEKKPYILVTTNNSSQVTYETVRKLGADFIMSKHQEGYSVAVVLDFLRIMKSVIKNSRITPDIKNSSSESREHYNRRISRRIMSELDRVGINPKAVGYNYLVDAISIMMENPMQNICTIVAEKHSKSEPSVERAMQNAINRAWKTNDIEELLKHYTVKINSQKGNPTITEFICYYANKLRNEY